VAALWREDSIDDILIGFSGFAGGGSIGALIDVIVGVLDDGVGAAGLARVVVQQVLNIEIEDVLAGDGLHIICWCFYLEILPVFFESWVSIVHGILEDLRVLLLDIDWVMRVLEVAAEALRCLPDLRFLLADLAFQLKVDVAELEPAGTGRAGVLGFVLGATLLGLESLAALTTEERVLWVLTTFFPCFTQLPMMLGLLDWLIMQNTFLPGGFDFLNSNISNNVLNEFLDSVSILKPSLEYKLAEFQKSPKVKLPGLPIGIIHR
jgi:hypothetical protein